MGDTNAVDIAQETHMSGLRNSGCMLASEHLVDSQTIPASNLWEGLYIDDHFTIAVVPHSARTHLVGHPALARQRNVMADSRVGHDRALLTVAEDKGFDEAERFVVLGTEVDNKSGVVGTLVQERFGIATLLAWVINMRTAKKKALLNILGLVIHSFIQS